MRLTQQANYSVRILMYCATKKEEFAKVSEIAQVFGISEYHLFKILPILVSNGFITTHRGRNGGLKLAKAPSDITLGQIIRAAEENFHLADCFDEGSYDCPLLSMCDFNHALNDALESFLDALDKYTLADLTAKEGDMRNLLNIEQVHTA
ncbi:Rrf2 family transcriptional regulator [uncultured Cohaesibacter sp.]|uniref:Rrf2 family transcriptional regulator n=1 Tax=uncultured Cohaesibacter sp. TaxID=1002546 RepID=UPI0029C8C1F8|nr:Rrf2 family transcriptional regulator [uncultured Cohaesibacter sp.]